MIGTTLALIAAAVSGLSVVLVRKHSTESNAFNVSLIISSLGVAILSPLAVLLTDFGNVNIMGLLLFALSGVLSPGIVRLLYYSGLKKLGAPANSSIFSTYPLYTSLLAVLLLNEVLLPGNWVGIVLVFLGGVLVEWSSREINAGGNYSRKNLIFPLLGGLTLGVSSIIRKYALDLYNAPVLGVAIAYSFSLIPYALILLFSASAVKGVSLKRDFGFFWKAGIGQAVTWVLSFYALSFEEVSVVNPLLSVEPIFVAFFAYLYLKEVEQVSAKLVVSIVLTVFGVILVTAKL